MDAGLLYQNAVVKSRETLLLGADRLQRISDAENVEEAVRLLAEAGYPLGANVEEILSAAERDASLLFKQCVTKGYGLELFLVIDDYHNAKVAAKSFFFGAAKEGYKPEGTIALSVIEESLDKQDYKALPAPMGEAFAAIEKMKSQGTLYPSSVDILLDKAAFLSIKQGAAGASKVIADYFTLLADLKNLSITFRAGRASIAKEKAREMLLPFGSLPEKDLLLVCEQGEEAAEKIQADRRLKDALASLKEGMTAFEVYTDDVLLTLLKKERYDMFSPAAIVGLYIGKLREIKNVRLILARIANGADKEIIKCRMRKLYV